MKSKLIILIRKLKTPLKKIYSKILIFFSQVKDWIKRLFRWFLKGKYFWVSFISISLFIFCIVIFDLNISSDTIMYLGLFLQFLGLYTILMGVNGKIKMFNEINPIKYHLGYFGRFPRFKIRKKIYNISGEVGIRTVVTGEIRGKIKPKNNFEDFYNYFENEIKVLEQKIHKDKVKTKEELSLLKKQLNKLKLETENKIKGLNETLKVSNLNSLDSELFGIFCFFLGILLSTVPDKIVLLF